MSNMPILGRHIDGCPTSVPFTLLNERLAYSVHGQTLSRLAERGGLSLSEIVANVEKRPWRSMTDAEIKSAFKEVT